MIAKSCSTKDKDLAKICKLRSKNAITILNDDDDDDDALELLYGNKWGNTHNTHTPTT